MLGAVTAPLTSLTSARPARRYDPGGLVIGGGPMAQLINPRPLT
jgi:hypothetical protein